MCDPMDNHATYRNPNEAQRSLMDDEIVRLYVDQGLSLEQVAQRLGTSVTTVTTRLKKCGIKRRSGQFCRIPTDDDKIVHLYIDQRLSTHKIARQLGITVDVVIARLEERGVKRRSGGETRRLQTDDDEIIRLYSEQQWPAHRIARHLGISSATVFRRLEAHDVRRRNGKFCPVLTDDDEIVRLYTEQQLSAQQVAKRLGVSEFIVFDRLEAHGVKRRSLADAHIIYERRNFSGDPIEKAYLEGFRLGDLHVKMANDGSGSVTIVVECTSTKDAQIDLLCQLFSPYGRYQVKTRSGGVRSFRCYLDTSFDFLLPKRDSLPAWVIRSLEDGDKGSCAAWLAGYIDAEGSFIVGKDRKAQFIVDSYDVNALRQTHTLFNRQFDILCPPLRLARPRGTPFAGKNGKQYYTNGDMWRLTVHRKASLDRLCCLLAPYLRHGDRREAMAKVWANVLERGI